MVQEDKMYLKSLINIPFGYCRVNQKYMVDITDFMLVEILMCILIVIMAKGIFEVKLSKLRLAVTQTEAAEKYIHIAKESLAQKQQYVRKVPDYFCLRKPSLPLMDNANAPRPIVAPTNAAPTAKSPATPNASTTNASVFNTSLKSFPDYESPISSVDLTSNKNSDPLLADSAALPEETETKKYTPQQQQQSQSQMPQPPKTPNGKARDHIRPSLLNIILMPNQSRMSYSQKGVNSTGTFTVGLNRSKSSNGEQATPSKNSKSEPQVLNSDEDAEDQAAGRQEKGKVLKSLSQEYNPPVSPKTTSIRGLRYSLKNAGYEKPSKGKLYEGRG